jgi:nucleoside-diphosphate-sugar epimerase
MKRILVTGATGFIGRHVTNSLREQGFEIHAVGRQKPLDAQVIFHRADLLQREETRAAVAAADASHLLHLAWLVEPGRFWSSPNNLEWVGASLELVRAFAERGGKRAVFSGTCAEYSWNSQRFVEDKTPCSPSTLYGASKDGLRRIVAAYATVASLSVAWGRIFFLYGPGEKQGRLMSDAIRDLIAGRELLTSNGMQRRDFMHVYDVAGALAALANSNVTGPVNIASGKAICVRSILEQIANKTGNVNQIVFGARDLPADEPEVIEGDVTRLSREVGYVPEYDLARGIEETLAWWQKQLGAR